MAAEFHISPDGKDANPGTLGAPVATLQLAKELVRSIAGKATVNVYVAAGVHYLPETLPFQAAYSGTKTKPVEYRAGSEGAAILGGGWKLNLEWTV